MNVTLTAISRAVTIALLSVAVFAGVVWLALDIARTATP